MLCSKCRNIENDENKNFCSKCGSLLKREDKNLNQYICFYENKDAIEHKSKIIKRLSIILVTIAIVSCLHGYKVERNVSRYVDLVRNGSFENHPNITISDGFDKFFEGSSWEYINSKEGYDIVEFSGSFDIKGQDIMTVMRFHINEDSSFEPNYLSFIDISQDNYILYDLIDTVMSSY